MHQGRPGRGASNRFGARGSGRGSELGLGAHLRQQGWLRLLLFSSALVPRRWLQGGATIPQLARLLPPDHLQLQPLPLSLLLPPLFLPPLRLRQAANLPLCLLLLPLSLPLLLPFVMPLPLLPILLLLLCKRRLLLHGCWRRVGLLY